MKLAPYDPNPTRDTDFVGKLYHWTWRVKKGAVNLSLHRGSADKCRRVHHYQDGSKA